MCVFRKEWFLDSFTVAEMSWVFLPSCQKQSREKKKDWKSKGIGNFLVQVVLAILKNWWEVRDFHLLQISEATRENSSSGKIY